MIEQNAPAKTFVRACVLILRGRDWCGRLTKSLKVETPKDTHSEVQPLMDEDRRSIRGVTIEDLARDDG